MTTVIIHQSPQQSNTPKLSWNEHNEIQVRGFRKMSLTGWLNLTDRAVIVLEEAHRRQLANPEGFRLTGHEEYMRQWIIACFADGEKSIEQMIAFYKERRVLFTTPPDPSHIVHCSRCSAILTNKISKALGYGPVCRTNPALKQLRAIAGGAE